MNNRTRKKVKKTISDAAQHIVYAANDEYTRAKVKNIITPILEQCCADIKVVCDETNNTPESIQQNKVIIDVYMKNPNSVEFNYIRSEIF